MVEQTSGRSADSALLVPVGESVTLRNTVAYAVEVALEADLVGVHFVAPVPWHDIDDVDPSVREATQELLDRVATWAGEDDPDDALAVETAIIGDDEYLFSPDDYAVTLAEYADGYGIDRIVIDPEYSPGGNAPILRSMEVELDRRGYTVEEAPVGRRVRRGRLLQRSGRLQFLTLFGVSFLFYQLLGGFALTRFDLTTGAASAAVVSVMLYRISLGDQIRIPVLARRAVRLALFVPYLLYEIIVSNLLVSYVILHPKMPIEPRMTEVRTAVWGGIPVTTLANSITLTPGTLTVRVDGRDFMVHTLIPAAREGLFDGALERGVRFVFYGRSAARSATPRERGDCRIIGEEDEAE
ncbi:monovalent cation/H+ antiporter subunit E [Natronomonas sp. F2-12]|jgi:multicomponent Na+:H+ antiporter subunit E|uniref:Monovalent cation/H+ antiporter subunit E n=1 Tax=Natronomonas aquatica TaxID=2841590 RepID=A0A9R1CVD8_9EURY|nr:monovalent cation/H+ antiporter subunit E [Natronomonas aquatica]MCQ4334473.1 monovalent cation/H+ antiporter subunit E [Natronomonas aquatica]